MISSKLDKVFTQVARQKHASGSQDSKPCTSARPAKKHKILKQERIYIESVIWVCEDLLESLTGPNQRAPEYMKVIIRAFN